MNRLKSLALASLPLLLTFPPLPALAQPRAAHASAQGAQWAFEKSDLPVDPDFTFGRLDNGLRYIIRHNATPAETGMVQMYVDIGSLSEEDWERGYAHFVEHMAFNGSTNVPEGEMVRLLEREGLAFGADTNASTNFNATIYKLDLPRNDADLLNIALFLMRETASELKFSDEAVRRERGVILSEKRVRDTYALRNVIDGWEFLFPKARFRNRLPIGTSETLLGATGATLRAFWQRNYVPANVTLVVVGDYDPAAIEAAIKARLSDWSGPAPRSEPKTGPVDYKRRGLTEVYLDPALAEQITISRNARYEDRPDTVANRQEDVLREIGYGIINRRFQRMARRDDPPFRSAGIGTSDLFKTARTANLVVNTGDGEWQIGLAAAVEAYRKALEFGFTEAEVQEQLANIRTSLENRVAGADTLSNSTHISSAISLVSDERIPTTAQSALERFEKLEALANPETVFAAVKRDWIELKDPLIRFEGRTAPAGGEAAIRQAWDGAMAAPLIADEASISESFAYKDFGTPGTVDSDTVEPLLNIRTIKFSNGLRLNLKQTKLQEDRVTVRINLDGGQMLNTKDNPLATAMASSLPAGGLGKHSYDDLQTIFAGRSVAMSFGAGDDSFIMGATTTPRDLQLQLELMAASLADPGFRPQGEVQYRRNIDNFFARRDATPSSALSGNLGGYLSDGDPRFTLQPQEAYNALSFAKLKDDIGDRLAHGALEVGIVGDFDPAIVIPLVARTLGALPDREALFRSYADSRERAFTTDLSPRTIYHDGPTDQALVRYTWPTTDDSDPLLNARLEVLEQVAQLMLTEKLREELGQTYSPSVNSSVSHTYPGWGLFSIAAAINTTDAATAKAAMLEVISQLRSEPVTNDLLLRARRPMLDRYDNALKSNVGWMTLVDRAQSQPDRLERFTTFRKRIEGVTAKDLEVVAQRYLSPDAAVEIDVLPRPKG